MMPQKSNREIRDANEAAWQSYLRNDYIQAICHTDEEQDILRHAFFSGMVAGMDASMEIDARYRTR